MVRPVPLRNASPRVSVTIWQGLFHFRDSLIYELMLEKTPFTVSCVNLSKEYPFGQT